MISIITLSHYFVVRASSYSVNLVTIIAFESGGVSSPAGAYGCRVLLFTQVRL